MAIRSFQAPSQTYATLNDTTTATAANYMSIGAAAAGNGLFAKEIMLAGQATASAVAEMQLARESTLGATLTPLAAPNSDGPLNSLHNPTEAQDGAVSFVAATTNPQRSAVTTAARLNLGLNAFGGLVRWNAAPGQEWIIIGVTVSLSESILSNFNGTNAASSQLGAHILYEPF